MTREDVERWNATVGPDERISLNCSRRDCSSERSFPSSSCAEHAATPAGKLLDAAAAALRRDMVDEWKREFLGRIIS